MDAPSDARACFDQSDAAARRGEQSAGGQSRNTGTNDDDIRPIHDPTVAADARARNAGLWLRKLSGGNEARPDCVPDHARGLMHPEFLQDPAAVRIRGFVTDPQRGSRFLG